ncbi:MAG: DNA polymerase III subunit delta' [Methylophagaceae bacterium]
MIYPWLTTQWQLFVQQKIQERVPHAIILKGVEGLGKRSFADQMAASLLCGEAMTAEACGHCHSCHLFQAKSHPDHIIIEPEEAGKQIKIEQIRRLKDKQELTSTVAKWKTVIISPADSMNINANNSLLKLLEEPQQNTLLILITARAELLPITIVSRCQKLTLSAPEPAVTTSWLQQQGAFSEREIQPLLPLANGAPLKVMLMLEQDAATIIEQVGSDFNLLMSGDVNPVSLAKDWQQYDVLMVFNHLQNLIQRRIVEERNESNSVKTKSYWYIYDCIIAAIKLISSSSNINKVLLIEQFMVSVMDSDGRYNTANNS